MTSWFGVNLTSVALTTSSSLALLAYFARISCAYPLDFFYLHRVWNNHFW